MIDANVEQDTRLFDRLSSRPALRALGSRNYRRYVAGQSLSNVGMWVQTTAELWLLLQLTGRGSALGVHAALRFGPLLVFGAHGGLVGDRFDRLRLLKLTQIGLALAAVVLAAASWMSQPSVVLIYVIVLAQGAINAVDNPLRRTFIRDLVDDPNLASAVSLHSSAATLSRTVGPAVAGVLIAGVGIQWCFTINAVSYGAVLVGLATIDPAHLRPRTAVPRAPRQVREGLVYAWRTPSIRDVLLLTFVVSMLGWNWNVILPVYATSAFDGGASTYGTLASMLGVGSLIGALLIGRRTELRARHLSLCSTALSIALAVTAWAPTFAIGILGVVLLGSAGTAFIVATQAKVQLCVTDAMSGRVLALYSVVFMGAKPLGGLIAGWITDMGGPRTAFTLGAIAVFVATLSAVVTTERAAGEPTWRRAG